MSKEVKIELWAIIDISKEEPRFCYSDETKKSMAIYDKKPKIEKHWRQFKQAVKVEVIYKPKTL